MMAITLCLLYAQLLFMQGYRHESLLWMCATGLILGCSRQMANAHEKVLPAKKATHFFGVVCCTAVVTVLAWLVYPINPWLISACLAACLCMHVHAGQNVFQAVVLTKDPPSSQTHRNQAIGTASLGLFFLVISPTSLGWLAIPALAVVLCLHGWRLWFCFRRIELSAEQHVDIWLDALNDTSVSVEAWIALKRYIAWKAIDTRVLRNVIARINEPDALLAYFVQPPLGVQNPLAMTQLVQERLCECDHHASMVFSVVSDPYEAADVIVRVRSGLHESQETLALPELDGVAYAA